MDSQFIRPQFLPQNLFGGSHITAQFFCALEFLFGNSLTLNNILDVHVAILLYNPTPALP